MHEQKAVILPCPVIRKKLFVVSIDRSSDTQKPVDSGSFGAACLRQFFRCPACRRSKNTAYLIPSEVLAQNAHYRGLAGAGTARNYAYRTVHAKIQGIKLGLIRNDTEI